MIASPPPAFFRRPAVSRLSVTRRVSVVGLRMATSARRALRLAALSRSLAGYCRVECDARHARRLGHLPLPISAPRRRNGQAAVAVSAGRQH
jgi:hypothetical protein